MTKRAEIKAIAPEETLHLRREMLRPDRPIEESIYDGDEARTTQHWGALVDNALVAIASLYPEPLPESVTPPAAVANVEAQRFWRLRGMAVSPQFQGQGYGAQLLKHCLHSVAEHGGSVLWCNARSVAVGFYRGAGFEISGDEFVIPGVGPHYVMLRPVEQSTVDFDRTLNPDTAAEISRNARMRLRV
jgi:ribosomal protein S18 acetylase RimI-like enzyme